MGEDATRTSSAEFDKHPLTAAFAKVDAAVDKHPVKVLDIASNDVEDCVWLTGHPVRRNNFR